MKYTILATLLLLMMNCSQHQNAGTIYSSNEKLVDLVNPLMGTDSEHSLSNGNTYPAIARPWGMNFWTPQTGKMGNGWCYKYDDVKIRGFKQTHQPSPWIKDYAAFSLMAVTGDLKYNEDDRASWFSHKAEVVNPHYYKVYLADYDVTAEFSPSDRAASFRFTFPESDESYLILDGFNGGSMVKIMPEERKIIGYCQNNNGGVPANFKNYFVAEFDKDFEVTKVWTHERLKNALVAEGSHVGAIVGFKTRKGEAVNVKVASSFISQEQAELNLRREIGNKTLEQIKAEGEEVWEKELSRILVEGGTDDQRRTFYSCLYRLLLFPRKIYEFNQDNEVVHYSPYNGEVLPGYMFTDNGFWDTFRAVFPFFTLMYPGLDAQIMDGLVNTYQESGWLPEWASPGHRDCMIGSNSASLIADSYLKGIRGYDIETLYEAILHSSEGSMKGVGSVGRLGAEYYSKLGYVPYDVGINESTARTLEYAYADFCIWKLAQELDRPQEEIDLFYKRARNFHKVFDPESKLMRGKNEDGTFQSPFNPYKWGDAFTEGNSWHYTWSVFQDVEGLKQLMGGNKGFVAMLDSVFVVPPVFDESYYGKVIHEIREMQISGMGNYAHGNQPIQHMIYLYSYTDQPWKGQYHVRQVLDRMYHSGPDGYCGDEDNGQTSAWYVFSSMGFYPVTPGTDEYIMGSPQFNKITLTMEDGNQFVITAANNSKENVYIENVTLNDKAYDKNFITHSALQKGGMIDFNMSSTPNKIRGRSKNCQPYSMLTFRK